MAVPSGHREFWGDGSGNTKALTAVFVAGSIVQTYTDSELILNIEGGGTAATFIELQMSIARPGSTEWQPMPVVYGDTSSSDTVVQEALVIRVPGTNGDHPCVIKTPANIRVRIDARRNGGAADTTALITGYVRDVVGESSISTLSQAAGAALTQDVNIEEIAGATTPATTVAGKMPCETDIRQIGGVNVDAGSVAGTFIFEGTIADDVADDGANPLLIGMEVDEVPSNATADARRVKAIGDLQRHLWVRSRSFDPVTSGDFKTNLNLDSSNHDIVSTALYNQTNLAAGAHYGPDSNGKEFDDRNKTSWVVGIRDLDFDFEVSNDQTNWVNVTASLVDHNTNLFGYDNTNFTEPDAATVYFAISFDNDSRFRFYRFKFTAGDNTNIANIWPFNRAV